VAPRGCENVSAACEIMDGLRFVSSLKRLHLGSVEGASVAPFEVYMAAFAR
jgi:hypothetical protein